ncbi:MAG: hypothetical protein K1X83_03415 [Oligoflexia bacterium]|nr:hypothetical protein [Oligoflexia bacterium]
MSAKGSKGRSVAAANLQSRTSRMRRRSSSVDEPETIPEAIRSMVVDEEGVFVWVPQMVRLNTEDRRRGEMLPAYLVRTKQIPPGIAEHYLAFDNGDLVLHLEDLVLTPSKGHRQVQEAPNPEAVHELMRFIREAGLFFRLVQGRLVNSLSSEAPTFATNSKVVDPSPRQLTRLARLGATACHAELLHLVR